MPAERTPTKASELRRSTKPIMEKRRRARINNSLSELKNLILDTLAKDNARHSKLEKADILEMTVKHLQQLQRQQRQSVISDATMGKFRAGYGECASEVGRYLGRENHVEPAIRQRLLSHLSNCITSFDRQQYYGNPLPSGQAPTPVTPEPASSPVTTMEPVHVQVSEQQPGNLELLATRLPGGELLFYGMSRSGSRQKPNQRPVSVLGSSGILSPAASDRSSPGPDCPLFLGKPTRSMYDPISPAAHQSLESVWRPW